MTTFAEKILAEARSHVGVREGPNNRNQFSEFFGSAGRPWCADFVSYCATKAGHPLSECAVDQLLALMKAHRKFRPNGRVPGKTGDPQPGDLVIFNLKQSVTDPSDHVGLVEMLTQEHIHTIEGNSGNQVQRKHYALSDARIVGYATLEATPASQRLAIPAPMVGDWKWYWMPGPDFNLRPVAALVTDAHSPEELRLEVHYPGEEPLDVDHVFHGIAPGRWSDREPTLQSTPKSQES